MFYLYSMLDHVHPEQSIDKILMLNLDHHLHKQNEPNPPPPPIDPYPNHPIVDFSE